MPSLSIIESVNPLHGRSAIMKTPVDGGRLPSPPSLPQKRRHNFRILLLKNTDKEYPLYAGDFYPSGFRGDNTQSFYKPGVHLYVLKPNIS